MDLNTVTVIARPCSRDEIKLFAKGDAYLAGGPCFFSEPQPQLRRLIDLTTLRWQSLVANEAGLSIAATCTVAELDAFEPPVAWGAATLIGRCCRSFLASFKIWNTATVGGNVCMALPAGPMISLVAALNGVCVISGLDGGERRPPVLDFVQGPAQNALRSGELLRTIELPREALTRHTAFRRISLTPLGRSGALLIGTLSVASGFALTVTASTRRPVRLAFARIPKKATVEEQPPPENPPGPLST